MGDCALGMAPVKRPGTVTAVAVMGFILGGGGLFGIAWVIVQLATGPGPGAAGFSSGMSEAVSRAWMFVSVPVNVLTSAAWIFAGVGLLRMRRWARTLAIVLLIVQIVMDVTGGALGVVAVRQAELPSGADATPDPVTLVMTSIMLDIMKSFVLAVVVAGVVLWLAYSIVMLVLITRRKVREAFARAALAHELPHDAAVPRQTPPPLPPSA